MRKLVIAFGTALLLTGWAAAVNSGAAVYEQAGSQGAPAKAAKAPPADVLDKLLAPIALYPDQLLAQMLLCASNPGKVAALSEWLASYPNEKGTALQDAATKAGFDQSFVALVLFPDVVNVMAAKLDWTTQLGNAFAADRLRSSPASSGCAARRSRPARSRTLRNRTSPPRRPPRGSR